jgi:hypothetical protein
VGRSYQTAGLLPDFDSRTKQDGRKFSRISELSLAIWYHGRLDPSRATRGSNRRRNGQQSPPESFPAGCFYPAHRAPPTVRAAARAHGARGRAGAPHRDGGGIQAPPTCWCRTPSGARRRARTAQLLIAHVLCFGFQTLTAAGYGDITPTHPLTRGLSNPRAVIGQLYPATPITRMVTLVARGRGERPGDGRPGPTAVGGEGCSGTAPRRRGVPLTISATSASRSAPSASAGNGVSAEILNPASGTAPRDPLRRRSNPQGFSR